MRLALPKRELPKLDPPRFTLPNELPIAYEFSREETFPVFGRAEGGLSSNEFARFISRAAETLVREAEVHADEPAPLVGLFALADSARLDGVPRPEPHPSRADP